MARTKAQKALDRARRRSARSMYADFRGEAMSETTARREPPEDPRVVVLDARTRRGATDRDDAARAMCGDPAGMAIRLGATDADEADRLWATFKRIDAADETYTRRKIGIRRFPNVAKMEFLHESLETRPDDRPDTRTQDEKDRDAVSDWNGWAHLLSLTGDDNHIAVMDAMRHRSRLTIGPNLTRAGHMFVSAMRALDDVYQRRK